MKTVIKGLTYFAAFAAVAILALPTWAGKGGVPQASITLQNSTVVFCNVQENDWTLEKTNDQAVQPVGSPTDVTWTITATKTPGAKTICADGFVTVTNTGSGDATIGNIVVNLQKPRPGPNSGACKNISWVSVAADMADATHGDAATHANILAAASAENAACNASKGPPNYTTSGSKGTFSTTAGSGLLEFTDADSNTIWALNPQQVIPPGGTVNLFFSAKFDNDVLNLPDNQSLRTEVIVSFGNAGARGGSGAVGTNIDIDGDGCIDSAPSANCGNHDGDEANVRSVPTRITQNLPPLEQCNDEVTIDDALSANGTAGFGNVGGDTFPVTTSEGGTWTVTATVTGGTDGGTVTNEATLTGESLEITVTTNVIDPDTGFPIELTFTCCEGADLSAESSVQVNGENQELPPPEFADGDFCTHTVQQWPDENTSVHPHTFSLVNFDAAKFAAAFPLGARIGFIGGGSLFDALWNASATGYAHMAQAIAGASGSAGPLTADLVDPTSMAGGSFTGEVAALTLNVGFSGVTTSSGPPASFPAGFGALVYHDAGQPLDGLTIAQILAAANEVAGQNQDPTDFGFASGNPGFVAFQLVLQKINDSFSKASPGNDQNACGVKQFAQDHLTKP
jgi:hypothetical protein